MASIAASDDVSLETTGACQFDNWQAFVDHLNERKNKPTLRKVFQGVSGRLWWGSPQSSTVAATLNRLSSLLDGTTKVQLRDLELLVLLKKSAGSKKVTPDSMVMALGIAAMTP